ncbi:cadmium-transporting ATPase domain protein [Mycobacterium kansasii]|uniref:Cadmium-transporting ATPase domain protein n=1 Tax=Mycobacterium kansasii TaxID=1768 RepID=A0A1V3WMN6_MYCKA|nr:cadmium-transporting ATPase domain protein [Mycobacterium kansasii]
MVSTVGLLAAGGIAWLLGERGMADGCWIAGTVLAVVPASVWVMAALRRAGSVSTSSRCCR